MLIDTLQEYGFKRLDQRFWSRVRISSPDECWIWESALNNCGYGTFSFNGKKHLSHRISYLFANGYIDSGLIVMHSCDNRKCVNPFHLSQGTYMDNMLDAYLKGRLVFFGRPSFS